MSQADLEWYGERMEVRDKRWKEWRLNGCCEEEALQLLHEEEDWDEEVETFYLLLTSNPFPAKARVMQIWRMVGEENTPFVDASSSSYSREASLLLADNDREEDDVAWLCLQVLRVLEGEGKSSLFEKKELDWWSNELLVLHALHS